ncbi:MAG: type IVB secretion system protein IcmH/DotU [Ascidiaceihabitans sp.]|uniref:type IVB secretion system protein IcmH/DotU n=1 Tax=Ascidiaceihabitans sp. TaxID=1872644 RepID=UPI00329A461D
MSDDNDKTVFGGKLPDPSQLRNPSGPGGQAPASSSPFDNAGGMPGQPLGQPPAPGASPFGAPPADNDRTVIGGALPVPPAQAPIPQPAPIPQSAPQPSPYAQPGRVAPTTGASPFDAPPQQPPAFAPQPAAAPQPPAGGNTWLGGALPQAAPAQPSAIGTSAIGSPGWACCCGFFPEMPQQQAQPQQQPAATPRISLHQALQATGLGKGGSSNPLVAAAANLLILFGRLRTGMVEMEAAPLMEHVTREIDAFERNAVAAGVDPHEALVAKYALCGTADDIVQNLPGADRGMWIQYSMVARFFQKRDSGVGFFEEAGKAMQAPGQRYQLLELMLTCLSLGFEGQYRTMPNGSVELARIRNAIYETLRRVKQRPDEDMSVRWLPVIFGGKRRFGVVPIWAIAGMAAAILVGFFVTLSTLVNGEGSEVATQLREMHPTQFNVVLERTAGPVFVAESSQLERIQEGLALEISAKQVEVGQQGEYIYVRVGNKLLFGVGSSRVSDEFVPLAARLTEVLNEEPGPILVIGHTDAQGSFAKNEALSVARAEAAATVLRSTLTDPSRVTVQGKGEAEPIATNDTAEGRAQNRRVDVLIAREGSL